MPWAQVTPASQVSTPGGAGPARGCRCLGRPSQSREFCPTPASARPAGLLGDGRLWHSPETLTCSVSDGCRRGPVSLGEDGGRQCPLVAARSDGPPACTVLPPALLDEIEAAELEGNDDRIEGVLCGAVKQLKVTRAKPDSTLYLSLMYLAKIKPNIFATEGVIEVRPGCPRLLSWEGGVGSEMGPGPLLLPPRWPPPEAHWLCPCAGCASPGHMCHLRQALCSLLRRDASINFKAKGNSLVSVLACNLLMAAYEEDENWPEIFVKVSLPLGGWVSLPLG